MKKKLITLLQILVTLGILGWLFRDPENNQRMWTALTEANTFWILIAIGAFGLVEVVAIIRLQILLRVQEIFLSWARVAALLMIGLFFNIFMPGGTGGDVVKIFYLLKETPGKQAAALLAVLMDRLVGLMAIIIIAVAVMLVRYQWLTQTATTSHLLWTLCAIFGSASVFIVGSYALTRLGWVHKLPANLPMREKLIEVSIAYQQYGRAWKVSLASLLISIPAHLLSFIQFYCVARAFSHMAQKVHLADFLSIMPIVNTLAAMPISVGGVGVREKLFVELFGDLAQFDEASATIISLTGFLVIMFWGLVGGVIYLFYRPSTRATASEAEATPTPSPLTGAEEPSR